MRARQGWSLSTDRGTVRPKDQEGESDMDKKQNDVQPELQELRDADRDCLARLEDDGRGPYEGVLYGQLPGSGRRSDYSHSVTDVMFGRLPR